MAVKVLITGGDGLIGSHMAEHLIKRGCYQIWSTTKETLDVTNYDMCKETIKSITPDLIIHCAAFTSVDKAEKEANLVYDINVRGTANIVKCCKPSGIPLLYFSSCSVFDGRKNVPYTEDDEKNPLSEYSKTKSLAETAISSRLWNYHILRVIHVYGRTRSDFVTQTINKLKNDEKPDIPVINQLLNITNVDTLCEAAIDLIETAPFGTYHYSNKGKTTRQSIIRYIAKLLNKTEFTISQYEGACSARPFYTIMDTSKIEPYLNSPIPSWRSALKEFIDAL